MEALSWSPPRRAPPRGSGIDGDQAAQTPTVLHPKTAGEPGDSGVAHGAAFHPEILEQLHDEARVACLAPECEVPRSAVIRAAVDTWLKRLRAQTRRRSSR